MNDSSSRRIVIVDRHRLYADSVKVALSLRGHHCFVEVTEGVATAGRTLAGIRSTRADVALMDLDLSHVWEGVHLIEPIVGWGTAVVVVTDATDPGRCQEALARGARGVLPKSSSLDTINGVIRQVTTGDGVLPIPPPTSVTGKRARQDAERHALRQRLQRLTGRESEVLSQLMSGRTVVEIARASVVSEATVRTQVRSILNKLEVSSQLAAVSIAHQLSWNPVTGESTRWPAGGLDARRTG